jgi:hypothetical protein
MRWPPASRKILEIETQFEGLSSKPEHVSVILVGMADISGTSPTTKFDRILVTGGSGFVGANLVTGS